MLSSLKMTWTRLDVSKIQLICEGKQERVRCERLANADVSMSTGYGPSGKVGRIVWEWV